MYCCGLDSMLSDMGIYFLQRQTIRQWDTPVTQVKLRIKTLKGDASGGTMASPVDVAQEAAADPALCRELADPYALCPRGHGFTARQCSVRGTVFDVDFGVWTTSSVMTVTNGHAARRSDALSDNTYDNPFFYDEAMITGTGLGDRMRAVTMITNLTASMLGIVTKSARIIMQRFLLPKSGGGPTPTAQLAGHYGLRLFGRTNQGNTSRVKVTGDRDPGYDSTSKMPGQAAISLAPDHARDDPKTGRPDGFWASAVIFDDRFVKRLARHAGLRFKRVRVDMSAMKHPLGSSITRSVHMQRCPSWP